MLLLEDSPPFLLTHNPADACLYASWRGPHTGEVTRQHYAQILQHARATQSTKLLNDALLDENGWNEIIGWLAEEYFLQLAKVGIQAIAWVLPSNPQAFCDTYQVLKRLQQPLVDTFTDAEAAYRWLHCPVVAGPIAPAKRA
ncbi:hypothetical protein FNT36_14305 [Hymenobacter setariae]|uniref:STAS/SEC14 domain-containing protein n=1 Tax=Hymenobacter setariae TaxID=2594794 RepID=A0A558BVV0_9BACT|nr:hypothetical protein [Hymenobacter setariae]TVT40637.1 hypothetical protein FNT36_14305 [Hymenobacter setariae]